MNHSFPYYHFVIRYSKDLGHESTVFKEFLSQKLAKIELALCIISNT